MTPPRRNAATASAIAASMPLVCGGLLARRSLLDAGLLCGRLLGRSLGGFLHCRLRRLGFGCWFGCLGRCCRLPGALAEAATALGLDRRRGEQLGALAFRQRGWLAILRNARVLFAVGDVRSVAAVQYLDRAIAETRDQAIAREFGLLVQQFERARQFDRVRIVLVLQRCVDAAVLDERTEAADAGTDRHAIGRLAEVARELEQVQRIFERDRVDALARAQAREARLVVVVLGADLGHRPVATEAHGHRFARCRLDAEFARAA